MNIFLNFISIFGYSQKLIVSIYLSKRYTPVLRILRPLPVHTHHSKNFQPKIIVCPLKQEEDGNALSILSGMSKLL
jgi:hypothetical protein